MSNSQQQHEPPSATRVRPDEFIPLVEFNNQPRRRILHISDALRSVVDKELLDMCSSLPSFGPCYTAGQTEIWTGKEEAWKHVLRRSSPTEESKTEEIYLYAMRRIEKEARNTYADGTVDHLPGSKFRWMMIKDGCFLLQLAIFALGGAEQLNYPPEDLIFGDKSDTKNIKKWIQSVFFVGNQIPLFVLRELMRQNFFRKVIQEKEKWDPPKGLSLRVLYELLLLPALLEARQQTQPSLLQGLQKRLGLVYKDNSVPDKQPSDLLHGLHLMILGPGSGRQKRIEAEEERSDLEADGEDGGGDSKRVPSATELRQAGIRFRSTLTEGIRGIKFKIFLIYFAFLTLPVLTIDEETETLFLYLKNYEIVQRLARNKREVSSYLRFMREFLHTPEDVELLAPNGIIKASFKQREKLPAILRRLNSKDSCQNLRLVKLKIGDHCRPPWEKVKEFLQIVLILAVVQTVYTVLSYYKDRR